MTNGDTIVSLDGIAIYTNGDRIEFRCGRRGFEWAL